MKNQAAQRVCAIAVGVHSWSRCTIKIGETLTSESDREQSAATVATIGQVLKAEQIAGLNCMPMDTHPSVVAKLCVGETAAVGIDGKDRVPADRAAFSKPSG